MTHPTGTELGTILWLREDADPKLTQLVLAVFLLKVYYDIDPEDMKWE